MLSLSSCGLELPLNFTNDDDNNANDEPLIQEAFEQDICNQVPDASLGYSELNTVPHYYQATWFKFTAQSSHVAVGNCASLSLVDSAVSLHTSCNSEAIHATALDTNDNYCNLKSQLDYPLEIGETYYVRWAALEADAIFGDSLSDEDNFTPYEFEINTDLNWQGQTCNTKYQITGNGELDIAHNTLSGDTLIEYQVGDLTNLIFTDLDGSESFEVFLGSCEEYMSGDATLLGLALDEWPVEVHISNVTEGDTLIISYLPEYHFVTLSYEAF